MTHHLEKIQELNNNNGENSLLVGNGEKLKIVSSSSSKITNLNLHDVFYVLVITKDILSVSKLTADDNIFVELYANYCLVKDKLTRKELLKGRLK